MNTVKNHAGHGISQFELTTNIVKKLNKYNITPTAKLVLILLTTHFNENKNGAIVFPSMPYIAETLGIGLTATKQAIKDLVSQGLILQSKRKNIRGNYNKYLLTLKVQNSTDERTENELFKSAKNDLSYIGTNNKNEINNKEVNKKEEKYLLLYAEKKGVKNKIAYINAIKKNGGAEAIIQQEKEKQQIEQYHAAKIVETKKLIEYYNDAKENVAPPPQAWLELGEKLRNRGKI